MTEQIVIIEESSQAKDVRAAVGSRYGTVLPAEGHLLDLCEPEDVNPAWKRWPTELLKPEGLYGTKPATGGNKAAKLKAIRAGLRSAKRVWFATDCDWEGKLIGQEILEHCAYRGEVMRVMVTVQDPKTIRVAFRRAQPKAEHARWFTGKALHRRTGCRERAAHAEIARFGLDGCPAMRSLRCSAAARCNADHRDPWAGADRAARRASSRSSA